MASDVVAAPVLDDGTLRVRIKQSDGSSAEHNIDVLLLQLTCEECVKANALEVVDGRYVLTAAFLKDLAKRVGDIGIPNCTSSIATRLWKLSSETIEQLGNAQGEMPS